MYALLSKAQKAAEQGDVRAAEGALWRAKGEYIRARKSGHIYYWRSWAGMVIAFLILAVCTAVVALLFFNRDSFSADRLLLILAGLGGGIGGCTAVLLQVIDVTPSSEVVSKPPWYVIKPALGAALGMITYLGVSVGVDVLSSGAMDSLEGATVIGFLAGFFESFSKGVLARVAGQYVETEAKPRK